jgi:hypothetical protein
MCSLLFVKDQSEFIIIISTLTPIQNIFLPIKEFFIFFNFKLTALRACEVLGIDTKRRFIYFKISLLISSKGIPHGKDRS